MIRKTYIPGILLLISLTVSAQNIKSPEEFLGYPIGTYVTRSDRVVAYFQELARLSDRATYQSIGQTFEYRQMPVLTVTSPANQGRIEEIRREHLASVVPGTPAAPAAPVRAQARSPGS